MKSMKKRPKSTRGRGILLFNEVKKQMSGSFVSRIFLKEYCRFLYRLWFMKHVLSVLIALIKIQKNAYPVIILI